MRNFIKLYIVSLLLFFTSKVIADDYTMILNPNWEKNSFSFKNSTLYYSKIEEEYQYRKLVNNNQIGYYTKEGFSFLMNIPFSVNIYNVLNQEENKYNSQNFILLENISVLATYEKKIKNNKVEFGIGLIFPSKKNLIKSSKEYSGLYHDFSEYYTDDHLSINNDYMIELGTGYKIIKDPLIIENKLKVYFPLTDKKLQEDYIVRYLQSGVFLVNNNISFFGDFELSLISKGDYFDENYIVDFGISYLVDSYSELKLGILNMYSNSSNNFGLIVSYQKIFN